MLDCRTQQDHPPAVPLPWLGQGIIHRESLMPCTHAGVVCTRRRAYGMLPSEGCYLLVLIEMAHHAIPIPVMLMLTHSIMPSSSQGSDDRQRAVAVQTRLIRATGYYQPCRAAYRGLSRSNWQPELREALWAQPSLACLVGYKAKKFCVVPVTSNLWTHVWSIKYR
jgi:hypothetical protein